MLGCEYKYWWLNATGRRLESFLVNVFMENIFKALKAGQEANQYTQDLAGRIYGLQWGIVSAELDPTGLRRIKVISDNKGAKTLTNWLMCAVPFYQLSTDTPPPGSLAIYSYINGDPNDGVYHGLVKNGVDIPDDIGWYIHRHHGYVLAVDPLGQLTVLSSKDDVSTSIELKPNEVRLTSGSTSMVLDNTGSIRFENINSFKINGKQVLTVDSRDSDGDVSITKGW